MKKLILGLVAAAAVAVPLTAASGPAFADVSTNGTTNDAYGWCQANHIANFNGDHTGIGWIRSTQSGKDISGAAGNKAPTLCADLQGQFAPISNNG